MAQLLLIHYEQLSLLRIHCSSAISSPRVAVYHKRFAKQRKLLMLMKPTQHLHCERTCFLNDYEGDGCV